MSDQQVPKLKYAKDFKCSNCNKQAVAFFGLADPDVEQYPYCKDCIDEMKINIYRKIGGLK